MARPMATRCRCPPDSAAGLRSSRWPICSVSAVRRTRSAAWARGTPAMRSAKAMLSPAVMCGYSAYDWNTIAMPRFDAGTSFTVRSPMRISPAVTSSRPAIMRSSVDLPEPDGPTSTTNSPAAIARSTPSITLARPS